MTRKEMSIDEAINVLTKYTDTESGISEVVAEAHRMAIDSLKTDKKAVNRYLLNVARTEEVVRRNEDIYKMLGNGEPISLLDFWSLIQDQLSFLDWDEVCKHFERQDLRGYIQGCTEGIERIGHIVCSGNVIDPWE